MKSARFALSGLVLLLSIFALGCSAEPSLVIDGATLIDVVDGEQKPDMRIVIRDGRIDRVGTVDEIDMPRGAEVVDGANRHVIPGLWDMHVHLHGWEETGPALLVANGVTGIREMGGEFEDIDAVRNRIASGEVGPRMMIAGEMLDGTTPDDWPFRLTATTPDEGRRAVAEQLARDVDFIKVKEFLDPETYRAIVDAADEAGVHVTGHVPNGMSAAEAASAGQRSIEHLAGTPPCCDNEFDAAVEVFLAQGTWHTPTLRVAQAFIDLDEGLPSQGPHVGLRTHAVEEFWNWELSMIPELPPTEMRTAWLEGAIAQTVALYRAGVPILAGTDLSIPEVYPGYALHEELALLVDAGLEPIDALRAATIEAAHYLDSSDSLGSIEVRKVADLVVLSGNPLDDIANTKRIHAVIVRGELLDRVDLDALIEASAAK